MQPQELIELKEYGLNTKTSMRQIAKEIGIEPTSLSRYYSGKTVPSDITLAKIREFLSGRTIGEGNIPQGVRVRNGLTPVYNKNATAGDVPLFNDKNEEPVSYLYLPQFKNAEFVLPLWGDSMYPKYRSGDLIAYREIKDLDVIYYGKVYLVQTNEQLMLKYVHPGNGPDSLTLTSENGHFAPIEIERTKITGLYQCLGNIRLDLH